MCEDNWMDEVRKELLTRCHTVANILSTLLDCSVEKPEKHLSPFLYACYMRLSRSYDATI